MRSHRRGRPAARPRLRRLRRNRADRLSTLAGHHWRLMDTTPVPCCPGAGPSNEWPGCCTLPEARAARPGRAYRRPGPGMSLEVIGAAVVVLWAELGGRPPLDPRLLRDAYTLPPAPVASARDPPHRGRCTRMRCGTTSNCGESLHCPAVITMDMGFCLRLAAWHPPGLLASRQQRLQRRPLLVRQIATCPRTKIIPLELLLVGRLRLLCSPCQPYHESVVRLISSDL